MAYKNIFRPAGRVRIIGGRWRGHRVPVLNAPGLRPTTDRVRETLFNWLTPVIKNSRCLDCFSGSGILSLEALSRGAAHVTMLENNRMASVQLTKNIQILMAEASAQVIFVNSLYWIMQPGAMFDIIFIDPPFYKNMIKNIVILLEQYKRLADKSWIYIETEADAIIPIMSSCWQLYREKISGTIAYRLYVRQALPKN